MSGIAQFLFGIIVIVTVLKACSVANNAFKLAKQGEDFSNLIKQFLILGLVFAFEFTVVFLIYGYHSTKDAYNLFMLYVYGLLCTYIVKRRAASISKKGKND